VSYLENNMYLRSRQRTGTFGPGRGRRRTDCWLCGLLLLLLFSHNLVAQELPKLTADVLADFTAARILAQNVQDPEDREKLDVLVRKLATHFPLVPVVEGVGGTNLFFKVELNRHKTGFDGVRFKVPPGPLREFTCVMAIPKEARPVRWYYTSLEGVVSGGVVTEASEGRRPDGSYFGARYDRFVPWGKDGDDIITITQFGPTLDGGMEYVIWFASDKDAAFLFQGAIKLPSWKRGALDFESVMGFEDN
jgi:hypothetical protein